MEILGATTGRILNDPNQVLGVARGSMTAVIGARITPGQQVRRLRRIEQHAQARRLKKQQQQAARRQGVNK